MNQIAPQTTAASGPVFPDISLPEHPRGEAAAPFFLQPDKAVTYLHAAAGGVFLGLKDLIVSNECVAYRVIERGGNEYERLGFPVRLTFGIEPLIGKEFSISLHFFNTMQKDEHSSGPRTKIDMHDHLMPIGILPFHPEGRLDEVAYEMERAQTTAEGVITSQWNELVRFGKPYAMLDPLHDLHAISSSQPHYSLMVAHTNGLRNPRESYARLFENPARTKDLVEMACAAQEVTLRAFMERWATEKAAADQPA